MKKNIITLVLTLLTTVSTYAVSVTDVAGAFKGTLIIGGTSYTNKTVYVLPGVESNTITFVLPEFKYNNASLGDIVLVNIPMNNSGKLTLENASLYIKAISERATISVINNYQEGGEVYNSIITAETAQVLLSIAAPSLPKPILVLFDGVRVKNENYAVTNGGFEGNWSNGEPTGWHSFNTATGSYVTYVQNTDQFTQSSEVRPGSKGAHSALIQTKIVLGNNANGNCTNGQINAGSMTATDAEGNYNFSDPKNSGYNTSFVGNPDSLVFWAKYIPADQKPGNSVNKARAHAVITTADRYQDPEAKSYASVKVAEAAINYSATSSMGWQRLAVPFTYTSVNPSSAAYMLVTFTTNYEPGGGSSYSSGSIFSKTDYVDNVYLDDVEMIYNHSLSSLKVNGASISFVNGQANTQQVFSDSDYDFVAMSNGKASQAFIGFDAPNNRVYIYVVADNFAQAQSYSVYTLQMAQPKLNTEYAYSATFCSNEPYSDNLFSNLSTPGQYTTTIPNKQGGDSVITLTLNMLSIDEYPTIATINMNESYSWRDKTYSNLNPGIFYDQDTYKNEAGCDSIYSLALTVKPIPYYIEESATICQNEESLWHNKLLPSAQAGTFVVYDSLKSIYETDSVFALTLTVNKAYHIAKTLYVTQADLEWRGKHIQGLPTSTELYMYYDSLQTKDGCDSVFSLKLYVSDLPITYGNYEAVLCDGEDITYDGVRYSEPFDDDVRISTLNMFGGDSVVHLVVKVLPSYSIEEYKTIVVGDAESWEGFDLSSMPVGNLELNATYYTIDDCDSTMVLILNVLPKPVVTDVEHIQSAPRSARKIMYQGHLYFIREDESVYDIIGKKINN